MKRLRTLYSNSIIISIKFQISCDIYQLNTKNQNVYKEYNKIVIHQLIK